MDFHNKYEERTVPEYWWSDNPEIDSWKQIVDYMHEMYPEATDKALQIAVSVFSQFLTENEIEIILVVFDKRSFQLSVQIVGDIDSYIDANYVRESHRKEYPVRSRSNTHMRELPEEAFYEEMLPREAENNYPLEEDIRLAQPCMLSADISLEDQLSNIGVFYLKSVARTATI